MRWLRRRGRRLLKRLHIWRLRRLIGLLLLWAVFIWLSIWYSTWEQGQVPLWLAVARGVLIAVLVWIAVVPFGQPTVRFLHRRRG